MAVRFGRGSLNDEFRVRLRGTDCIYCGERSNSEDHWPPVAYSGLYGHGFIFPCCIECNQLGHTAFPLSFVRRADYIKTAIRRKYSLYLKHIEWSDKELQGLSIKLRKEYESWQKMKKITQERIAWNAIAYFSSIVLTSDFVLLSANLSFLEGNEPSWFTELKLSMTDL